MNTQLLLLQTFCDLETPQYIKDVLVGNILGDGHINNYYGFMFAQSTIHKEYILFLFAIYAGYTTQKELSFRSFVDSRYNKTHSSLSFSLRASQIISILNKIFYDNRIKVIRWESMYTLLTPCVIAFWIMDDGQHVKRGGVTLCTDNYTYAEVFNLILILEMKFGLVCTIHTKNYSNRSKLYYRIYISGGSIPLLRSLVIEYMHPSMMYKIT